MTTLGSIVSVGRRRVERPRSGFVPEPDRGSHSSR